MDFDINTPEGMAASVRWTEQYISHLKDGRSWIIPRSGTVVTVFHTEKRVSIASLVGDPAVTQVFTEMGWKVDAVNF
jgi:hypothetical protein